MRPRTERPSHDTQASDRPKLVFLRSTAPDPAHFVRLHLQEHVKCLSEFFDVILISQDDCDYRSICEVYKPDIALFESGVYVTRNNRRTMRNTDAFPEIPKLGLCNGDAYCRTRQLFLSDMYRWGIDTFFAISVSMGEYTPDIADRLFVWPNFADGDLYKDYGEPKLIPVLFAGSFAAHYPWRNQVYDRLSQCYPSLRCPHLGWSGGQSTARMVYGEQYARLLNASLAAPACGTFANDIVRKHFEIPGSKACLVAPRTAALEAAGFIDMENCVFAEANDVVAKLGHLFSNRDELDKISLAGYKLVHSAHTLKHRNQVYQWFKLNKTLRADCRIIQPGPFQPLTTVCKNSGINHSHTTVNGLDRLLLREGDQKLSSGKYREAERLFLKCLTYYDMPEPKLRMVITNLLAGDSAAARHWSVLQIKSTLESDGAVTPDPVEWAYLILTTLCEGHCDKALKYASAFPGLRHHELDRARIIANIIASRPAIASNADVGFQSAFTVHQLPHLDMDAWVTHVARMLSACGQRRFIERIASVLNTISAPARFTLPLEKNELPLDMSRRVCRSPLRPVWMSLLSSFGRTIYTQAKRLRGFLLDVLEGQFGYFLPYALSTARRDELFAKLETICRDGNISTVIIMGAHPGNYVTEACVRGARYNSNGPAVLCITNEHSLTKLRKRYRHCQGLQGYQKPQGLGTRDNTTSALSVVVINGPELPQSHRDFSQCYEAAQIVLHDLGDLRVFEMYQRLVGRSEYALASHNPELRGGYAIFRRSYPHHETSLLPSWRPPERN